MRGDLIYYPGIPAVAVRWPMAARRTMRDRRLRIVPTPRSRGRLRFWSPSLSNYLPAIAHGGRDAFFAMRGSGSAPYQDDLRRQHALCVLPRQQPRKFSVKYNGVLGFASKNSSKRLTIASWR